MDKLKRIELSVHIIVLVMFIVALLLLPVNKNVNYWISLFFSIMGLTIFLWISRCEIFDGEKTFLFLPIPILSFLVTVVQIIWNGAILFIETINIGNLLGLSKDKLLSGTEWEDVPVKALMELASYVTDVDILEIKVFQIAWSFNLIVNLLLVLIYMCLLFSSYKGALIVGCVEKTVQESIAFHKWLQLHIEAMIRNTKCEAAGRMALVKLLDEVKYSDPVSNEHLAEIENVIKEKAQALEQGIAELDSPSIVVQVEEISALLAERNSLCKRSK